MRMRRVKGSDVASKGAGRGAVTASGASSQPFHASHSSARDRVRPAKGDALASTSFPASSRDASRARANSAPQSASHVASDSRSGRGFLGWRLRSWTPGPRIRRFHASFGIASACRRIENARSAEYMTLSFSKRPRQIFE